LPAVGVGTDIGTQSDLSPALFTPPTYTFAIWTVIYPAMICYAVYQALPGIIALPRLRRVGWWTALAMAANAAWAAATVLYGVALITVVLIFVMLAALITAFMRLYRDQEPRLAERVFVIFPISIFAAWITAAAIANTSSWLTNAGGFEGGPLSSAQWVFVLSLVGGVAAGATILANKGNFAYTAVFVWALIGVAVKSVAAGAVLGAVGAGLGIVIAVIAYCLTRVRWQGPGSPKLSLPPGDAPAMF
jgi:hypothetical protein